MRKTIIIAAVLALMIGALAFAAEKAADSSANSLYYVCNCGPDCNCNSMSREPGNCSCGKPMKQTHLLAIENGNALFCTCGAGCTCKINEKDHSKCGCGNQVKKISLKGKYICACGEGCNCNTISDKPGNCACGKPMKQVM